MLKSLSDNLNMLMAKNKLNSNELARFIGIPATTIKRIRNNEQSNPTITTLLPIAEYFSVSLNQLIGRELLTSSKNYREVPILSWHECAHYASYDYNAISRRVFTERNVGFKAFALIVENDHLDFFLKNSILIIDPEKKPVTGDYVLVCCDEPNIASIKKYIVDIDNIYLKSLIPGMELTVLISKYKIIGVIIQYKLDLKF